MGDLGEPLASAVRRRPARGVLASLCIWAAGGFLRTAERLLGVPSGSVLRERYRQHNREE